MHIIERCLQETNEDENNKWKKKTLNKYVCTVYTNQKKQWKVIMHAMSSNRIL